MRNRKRTKKTNKLRGLSQNTLETPPFLCFCNCAEEKQHPRTKVSPPRFFSLYELPTRSMRGATAESEGLPSLPRNCRKFGTGFFHSL